MIALLNTIIFIVLLMPESIKVSCLDLFYLLVLGCLIAIFTLPDKPQEQELDELDEYYQINGW